MQTRTSFNGGEQSVELGCRCDLDAYMRGCQVLENWHLSQMGGVKRRRGMRRVCPALGEESRLFSYIYSYANTESESRFLVEVAPEVIRVLGMDGAEVARFESGVDAPEFSLMPEGVRVRQINALMILTSTDCAPMVLRWDGDGGWTLKGWEFKSQPWRHVHERRDWPVVLTSTAGVDGMVYKVDFSAVEDERELPEDETADVLRCSFYLEQQEAEAKGQSLRTGIQVVDGLVEASAGARFAVRTEPTIKYYVCKKEWPADVYVTGLDAPESYPDNFEEAENLEGFEGVTVSTSVKSVTGGSIAKGKTFGIESRYWELYTCVRAFTSADMVTGATSFADYPGFFVRGVAVGDALPCRGAWEFYCSGLWYGSYEVRRSYDGPGLAEEWETRGISFSRVSAASNTQLTGDESDEECWLRLFLTRTKCMDSTLVAGWPADSCGNRLIVPGYRHDMVLVRDVAGEWTCADKVDVQWLGRRTVYDWSWQAFGGRYGYPLHCEVFQQRLVFAATMEQPQTVWMSRTDDLGNFAVGDGDDSALALTLNTTSQNPICWLFAQGNRLTLGTSESEWSLAGNDDVGVSPKNVVIHQHGRHGSDGVMSLAAEEKVLYIERGGGRCWEFGYSIEIDGYRSRDLTVFAPHVLSEHGGALQGALLRKPDPVAVFVLGDGQLALCTYNSMHEVHAWHRWVTDGRVLAAAAMPDGTRGDRLFLVVERDGAAWIEVVDDDSDFEDAGLRDYASLLVTNALENPLEALVKRRASSRVLLFFNAPVRRVNLELSSDGGESWVGPSRTDDWLERGWHELTLRSQWRYGLQVGVRFSGKYGLELLAIQA